MKSFMNNCLKGQLQICLKTKQNTTNPNSVQQPEVLCISNFIHTQTLITKAENKKKVQKASKCM